MEKLIHSWVEFYFILCLLTLRYAMRSVASDSPIKSNRSVGK